LGSFIPPHFSQTGGLSSLKSPYKDKAKLICDFLSCGNSNPIFIPISFLSNAWHNQALDLIASRWLAPGQLCVGRMNQRLRLNVPSHLYGDFSFLENGIGSILTGLNSNVSRTGSDRSQTTNTPDFISFCRRRETKDASLSILDPMIAILFLSIQNTY